MGAHQWRFFRAGGMDQVQLRSGADLLALEQLDQKLWMALACPVDGIEFDRRTLELIDEDGDRRVRASELIAAIKWANSALTDIEHLARASDTLALSAIAAEDADGAPLLAAARGMLRALDKADADAISVADAEAATEAFDKQRWNGDGVVPVSSCEDPEDATLVEEILGCIAQPPLDRNGEPGIDTASLDAFEEALGQYLGWRDAGLVEGVLPLGEQTADAVAAYEAIRAKIDDYFARGRVAAYDSRALDAINREQSEYLAIAAEDLQIDAEEVAKFPLARVTGAVPLPLGEGINPAWAAALRDFVAKAITPILGEISELNEAQWAELSATFAPYQAWAASKAGESVEQIEEPRLREIFASGWRARLDALIEQDLAEKPNSDAIAKVEKLVRYSRDLMSLANNFVSFRHFYARQSHAVFQLGTLYIDQRSCELCVDVTDAARHTTMSPHANLYLLYCDLRNAAGQTRSIAAAMTNGDQDNMMVGRNGVFYDRDGNDWDATVTRIVENPISVRQAFWAPYKKFLRMVEAQFAKRAQAAEAAQTARLEKTATQVGDAGKAADPAADAAAASPETPPKGLDIGVLAAIGVGVSGAVAAAGLLLEAFFGLGIWMPLGVVGLLLMISGPSMLIAWLKLRQRNLAPLLDANGWAVNAHAKINTPLGRSLTQLAVLPKGASRDLADPFAEKKKPWPVYVALVLIVFLAGAWYLGKLDPYLPPAAGSVEVLGEAAPASISRAQRDAADAAKKAAESPDGAGAEAPALAEPAEP